MTKAEAKWPPTTTMDAAGLYWPIKKLAELALRFAKVDRATRLLDGSAESDTDHTVMLGWIAPALAARCSDSLDVGLVAQFALVHDAPEVLAGDVPTLAIGQKQRVVKKTRERRAMESLAVMFGATLPWFPEMILRYEQRIEPEARFVWALDKLVVKITNLFAGCHDITAQGVGADGWRDMVAGQRPEIEKYASDFPGLLGLYDRLCAEVEARLMELALPQGVPDNEAASAVTFEESGHVAIDHSPKTCTDYAEGRACMFCDGGLFACARCGSFEGATTTHCPGRKMTADQHDAVYAGTLDFRRKADGSGWWVAVGSPHTPNKGWESAAVLAAIDEFPIDDVIEHVTGGTA